MYHALITNRYLTSRMIPFIAVAAVGLCVALVIIVVSVMTGFLEMIKSSGRTLMGDVVISYPVTGIPHYERLIELIEQQPEASAATAVVDSWGLLRMPYPQGDNKETETVQVWAVESDGFSRVTGLDDALYWRPVEQPRTGSEERFIDTRDSQLLARLYDDGSALRNTRNQLPPMILGMHVSIGNDRQSDGSYTPKAGGYWMMPMHDVALTMLPIVGGGIMEPETYQFQVVNEFISGVFLIDEKRIIIPLEWGQRMLHLDPADILDPDDEDVVLGVDPARATMVLVRGVDGVDPIALREIVHETYLQFLDEFDPRTDLVVPPRPGFALNILTWEQQQAQFIGPVEKERELMRTLFMLVYLVCAGLVLSIFWAIVYEKTRDIGILRSMGASRLGISWIFLRYGLVIGVLGSVLGLGLGNLVVHNINAIHDAMGKPPIGLAIAAIAAAAVVAVASVIRSLKGGLLPAVLGTMTAVTLAAIGIGFLLVRVTGGVVIWDPKVYYFTEIPNDMDVGNAIFTMVGAVIFSLLGAFVPAARAADTDPVRALRYE